MRSIEISGRHYVLSSLTLLSYDSYVENYGYSERNENYWNELMNAFNTITREVIFKRYESIRMAIIKINEKNAFVVETANDSAVKTYLLLQV
ncbi:MAG: hypothetical protein J6R32_00955 [Bacteroidales bacterium]|nr:hypothetical protein [Bacteroidales bacterium]